MAAPSYVYDLLASESSARWGADSPVGRPVTISYSFATTQRSDTSYPNFTAFSATEIAATREALDYIASLTGITFVETSAAAGDLQFANGDLSAFGSGVSGRATYGYTNSGIQNATVVLSNTGSSSLAGSDFVPGGITANDIGGHGWGTLLHEIGHALGLKHPFEPNIAGDPGSIMPTNLDDLSRTVMSYTPYQPSNVAIVTGNASSYSYRYSNLAPETYGLYDIAALQYLYGKPQASAGNKVFAFSPSDPTLATLYDTGPDNTIDCSALTGSSTIDLNAGKTSHLAISQDLPFGIALPDQYDGSSAVTLAYGCVITNAIGGSGADRITGNGLANRLDGGAGADTMKGGLGNDVYLIDAAGDRAIESAGQGTDTVKSSVSLTLGGNLENLILTGSGAINGTGNAAGNSITGNGAANTLTGGGGADKLKGGAGNDTYVSDGLDTITETSATGGTDRVVSSGTLTLGANVENLTLSGSGAINGIGNALANVLTGNGAANKLVGLAGHDTLTGGAGADFFVFRTLADSTVASAGRDLIKDFSQAQHDRLDFRDIDAHAGLPDNQSFSFIGGAAFHKTAGELRAVAAGADTLVSGDVDGNGSADFSVLLRGHLTLQAGDFLL
ncbi:M10 family metallopeptidase [Methylobacterium sp. 77]|uniref:M10 family metallopeptidase n=1 Tax=Methylobacterium sp. 77 TaxID=1101192 RepID=UPI00035D7A32|nr:M10 family metallopeptidase [Methylobacterium sp. 77]